MSRGLHDLQEAARDALTTPVRYNPNLPGTVDKKGRPQYNQSLIGMAFDHEPVNPSVWQKRDGSVDTTVTGAAPAKPNVNNNGNIL